MAPEGPLLDRPRIQRTPWAWLAKGSAPQGVKIANVGETLRALDPQNPGGQCFDTSCLHQYYYFLKVRT